MLPISPTALTRSLWEEPVQVAPRQAANELDLAPFHDHAKPIVPYADAVEVASPAHLLEIADLLRGGRRLDLLDRSPDAVQDRLGLHLL